MAVLGTKKFWKPSKGASATQKENQILKNGGYINLQLRTVNYMSVGNVWQSTFGGKDKIALATTLKYQSGVGSVEATSVQDVREVKVNKNYNLGLQRNIAVKIPSNADAISIEVKMTAVKDDSLQAKFDMLNQPEYQSALQLAPTVIGQVLTITSLVKKLFSESNPQSQLEASYAGIISSQSEDNPVSNGKLTSGLLIMISTNDGDQFNNVDESKFDLKGDSLLYNNKQVENTYLVFNISFEQFKGDDESSAWFKKYNDALNNLDKMQTTQDIVEIERISNDSKTMWIEGNALLDADSTYINKEKIKLKGAAIASIIEKFNSLKPTAKTQPSINTAEMLQGVTGSSSFRTIALAIPETGNLLKNNFKMKPKQRFESSMLENLKHHMNIEDTLEKDKNSYLKSLKKQKLTYNLGKK